MRANRLQIAQLILTTALVVLLAATLGGGRGASMASAAAPQAGAEAAVPGGPGYVMVPATAFVPENPTDGYRVFWGELSVPEGSPYGYSRFNAPVYLPQGARLTGITMYYRDTENDTNTLGVDMLRKPLPGLSSGENVGLSVYSNLIDYGTYQSDTTPEESRAVVDNSQYAYYLSVYIYAAPAYLQLQAVRVDYSFGAALPLIQR